MEHPFPHDGIHRNWPRVRAIGAFLIGIACFTAAAAGEPANIRTLPYPFAHVVSFSSDADAQRPWHGAAIHRLFNQEIGLTISDSLWPHGSAGSSALFNGPNTPNRNPSGVGTEPTFALLLREWHRGNIDQFHSWQDDAAVQLRDEPTPPVVLSSASVKIELSEVLAPISSQRMQNVRLYFNAEPPADLALVLREKSGASVAFDSQTVANGRQVQTTVGEYGWIVEVIVPQVAPNSPVLAVNPVFLSSIDLIAPSCAKGCSAGVIRIERDHFSRNTVQAQLPQLSAWNIRPALLTSHGGYTFAQNFGIHGKALEIPRTAGSYWADKTVVSSLRPLANEPGSHAYHADLLQKYSVLGVWSYFGAHDDHVAAPLDNRNSDKLVELTTTYPHLYDVPRTYLSELVFNSREAFIASARNLYTTFLPEEVSRLYCGVTCDGVHGEALSMQIAASLNMVRAGRKAQNLWYTHFGSSGTPFIASYEFPLTADVTRWMRMLANYVYNFDGSVSKTRRIWSPPASVWLRYKITMAKLGDQISLSADRNTIQITPWTDVVTGHVVPDLSAGTRDLHGVTVYVADPSVARIFVGAQEVHAFVRNAPDETGQSSITIVDDHAPTPIFGNVPLRDRGTVNITAGRFNETSGVNPAVHTMSIEAAADGSAAIDFTPYRLDLWNTTHLYIETIRRVPQGVAQPKGRVRIELEMQDGGTVTISEGDLPSEKTGNVSVWNVPPQSQANTWRRTTLGVAQLDWPNISSAATLWRRPPLPLGRVKQVRLRLENAVLGEKVEIRSLSALRPDGNGESPDHTKLVSGRVTTDGLAALSSVIVHAQSSNGDNLETVTDQDGYYFFYRRPRGEKLAIKARFDNHYCFAAQGRQIEVLKNEAELDIETSNCLQ